MTGFDRPLRCRLRAASLPPPLRAAADHSLFKDSPNPFIDGCASSRFESSIHKQIKKYTLKGVFLYLVGMTGFEPAAFASRTQRSTKLSHIPAAWNIIAQPGSFFKS